MKRKAIVGLLFCMLLIPTIITSADTIDNEKTTANFNDDVPTWNEGNSWTFTVNDFWVDFNYGGNKISMNGKIDDFQWTVSDTSGSSYTVDIAGKITASFNALIPIGGLFLNISGTLNPTWNRITGTIIFGKSNLEIEDFNAAITGIARIMFNPIPINFPIPIKITADSVFSTPFPTFNFPLHILKFWNMPELDIDTNINIGGILGLIKFPLPVMNVHYDWTPLAFSCLSQDNINVEAGNFDTWKIQSLLFGYFEYWYAPSVGNIVQIEINMPRGGITAELKSTNYV